ncbi:putative large secreted protein [Acidisarcina polymorpha]|uniref:Putative large secreted protein n=2 Tax=Acidisarcina polymorpha TaxID=2211140 RepID=A0A2Z5G3B5_9BACT|nr:putative large secreted protein [Acidisarcina polymorpha]
MAAFLLSGTISLARGAETPAMLHFDRPASKWTEAIPLGNGRIGAMVFGGVQDERYQINEATLWGGGPHDYDNPEAYNHLDEVRKLIFADKVGEAEQLASTMMGNPKVLMPYQPFCDLRLHFAGDQQATGYSRDLNLENAISNTAYKVGESSFLRESFVSFPDQVLVIRLTASQPGQLTFSVGMDSPQPGFQVTSGEDGSLHLTGQIQPRQNKPFSWTGSWDQPETRYAAALKVLTEGGSVRSSGNHLDISGANSVTLLFSNATSFKDFRDIGGDPVLLAQGYLDKAVRKPYEQLRQDHIADYSRLFSRVHLQLGPGNSESNLPTNQRIEQFSKHEDPSLLALYFEFGRYLLISCSRRGGQPANLQGIWNDALLPPWSSKWTTNINLEMNYWQADAGDLWETEDPLWGLIADLQQTGAETARVHYHSAGWVLHHNTDVWRATTPVDGPWGIWPMGEAWLSNQMWDHYLFSNDRSFLAQQAYPAMKAAATFIVGTLVEVPSGMAFAGDLVTNPSTSPENAYLLNGKRENLTYAPTMDLELIRELFENTRKAAQILGEDSAFGAQLEQVEKRLPPLQIGKRGQLQEWIKDYDETELEHRHVSHLYSVYPGHDINPETTPELAKAAYKSLEIRGDGSTGWSQVWRVALWARLGNPEQAYRNLTLLINQSTLPNMFDLCGRPFQIDGNLGGPAVMMEMLVQSTNDEISILPALPKEWPDGSLTGVRLRGGAKADITWRQGRLTSFRLHSDHGAQYRLLYAGQQTKLKLQPGRTVVLDASLHARSEHTH